jgi:microsomal dipeptidase-like Zn-dependent dipeptidase
MGMKTVNFVRNLYRYGARVTKRAMKVWLAFNATFEPARRGYTGEQVEKLWGGNLVRVMDEVRRIAQELRTP